jgi:N6-adenosine-specific RNA methylase IME4
VRNGYRCLVIDPPTRFVAGTKGRPQHYNRMTDADIATLPIADLLHPEGAWIFLWVTSPKLYAPPRSRTQLSPDQVARAWGARYSGRAFVWIKTKAKVTTPTIHYENDLHIGMGFTTRKNAEDCLLFRTGMPQRLARDVHEVIVSPVREHSRKPDEAFTRIERFCPGPRVELFAREAREGWDTWGDQVGMFNEPILTGAGDILVGPTGPTGGTWCPLQPTGTNLGLRPFEVPVSYGPTGTALFEHAPG